MNFAYYVLLISLCLSGCTIITHLDEISTLSAYSREKDGQHRLVKSINDHYDALAKAYDQNTMGDYPTTAAFEHSFGAPILKKNLNNGGQRWLYRHAIYRLSKDQIFVTFDRKGRVVRWEKQACSKFF